MPESRPPRSRAACAGLLGLGLALRILLLPLPGTLDVSVWKIWAFAGSTERPARLYADSRDPHERRLLRFQSRQTTVDYPPLAVDVLAVVGRAYRAFRPAFPDGPALTAAVKLPVLLADALLAGGLWTFARRRHPRQAASVLFHWWLGPAVLLNGAALGYLDPLAALPLTMAFVAVAGGRWGTAGMLGVAAALVKAQAAVPLLALVWASWRGGRRALLAAWSAGGAVALIVLAPVVYEGAWPGFLLAMRSLTRHDMVSGNAMNVWWLYTWVFRAVYDLDLGPWQAFSQPVRILALSTVEDLGHASPKPLGIALVAVAFVWAMWRASRVRAQVRDGRAAIDDAVPLWALAAALGAFLVHAYFVLGVQVHENHLFLAIPLALLASLALPAYRRVALMIGAVQALNLFVFYGISEGIGWTPPRGMTGVDVTVWLALLSVWIFLWHVAVFSRATSPVASPQAATPARASIPPRPSAESQRRGM